MKKEEKENWLALYELGSQIKQLAPWKTLYDVDFITLHIENYPHPILVSILGHSGECFGISVHHTPKGHRGAFSLYLEDNGFTARTVSDNSRTWAQI